MAYAEEVLTAYYPDTVTHGTQALPHEVGDGRPGGPAPPGPVPRHGGADTLFEDFTSDLREFTHPPGRGDDGQRRERPDSVGGGSAGPGPTPRPSSSGSTGSAATGTPRPTRGSAALPG